MYIPILTSTNELANHTVQVHNMAGQLMANVDYISGMVLDVSAYDPGVYLVQTLDHIGHVVNTERIVKM